MQSTSPLFARNSYWCIVKTIEAAGYAVKPYQTAVPSFGVWGFALARLEPFDIVLLDLNMPRMNGLEAAAALRKAHGPRLPIVALTASVSPADVASCRAAGMDGFVAKPVEAEELYRVIGELMAAEPEQSSAVA